MYYEIKKIIPGLVWFFWIWAISTKQILQKEWNLILTPFARISRKISRLTPSLICKIFPKSFCLTNCQKPIAKKNKFLMKTRISRKWLNEFCFSIHVYHWKQNYYIPNFENITFYRGHITRINSNTPPMENWARNRNMRGFQKKQHQSSHHNH